MRTLRAGLTVKLAIALVASTAIIFGIFGWLNLRAQRIESEQMVQLSADRVGDIIKPDFVDYGGTVVFDGPTQTLKDGSARAAAGVVSLHRGYLERMLTSVSGTSFASPLVAYKAAIIREAFPNASANLVRALLAIASAEDRALGEDAAVVIAWTGAGQKQQAAADAVRHVVADRLGRWRQHDFQLRQLGFRTHFPVPYFLP